MAAKDKDKEPSAPAEVTTAPPVVETPEQRIEREQREDYMRRFEESQARRRQILASNNLPDDTAGVNPMEAYARCCGR